jgi:CBS domain containing-hemolysin-like protein
MISIITTVLILLFGEAIPKQIGINHSRNIAIFGAYPLTAASRLLSPLLTALIFVSRFFSRQQKQRVTQVSAEEVLSLTEMGSKEGVIDSLESSVIKNVLLLDKLLIRDILTPRVVVYRLEATTLLKDVAEDIHGWQHTRIPIFYKEDADHVTHYVIQRDICRELMRGNLETQLLSLARPIHVVPEVSPVDNLLNFMVSRGEHIASAVDEHGGFAGIVTLEDIIEEVVGKEIIDEYDLVEDMRKHAENLNLKRELNKRLYGKS